MTYKPRQLSHKVFNSITFDLTHLRFTVLHTESLPFTGSTISDLAELKDRLVV